MLELSGGNDGLNTVVPHADPAYYRARPRIGIPAKEVLKVSDAFGFHPSMVGFERLYKDGRMAVVHGCGYDHPSLSHFSSMSYWHTGVPNAGEPLGWLGRAGRRSPQPRDAQSHRQHRHVAVARGPQRQALAARLRRPVALPARRHRRQKKVLGELAGTSAAASNATLDFLSATARNAADSSDFVRQASAAYRTPVDYGIGNAFGGGLQRVAALINAGMKTRLYYVAYQGNSFDTHVQQGDVHSRLLMYTADAVRAFMEDIARIGRADDVAVLMFTEFGRRVEENGSLGTDHGTATPMFLFGKQDRIKGGFYGQPPSLTDLDDGNLKMTTDFRRVYATAIKEWLGYDDADTVLKGRFETLRTFA